MIKRKNFEAFIKSYQKFDQIDSLWNEENHSYQSAKTQKLYQFYNDIFEYDVGYKTTIIKSVGAIIIAIGLILMSVMAVNYLNDIFIKFFPSPINGLITFSTTLLFMSLFFLYLTFYLHRMFDSNTF